MTFTNNFKNLLLKLPTEKLVFCALYHYALSDGSKKETLAYCINLSRAEP